MGRLRTLVAKLRRDAKGAFDSFTLKDGSTYRYDRMETHAEIFQYGHDVLLGDASEAKWPEPPEIFRKMCEARDPAAVLEHLRPENPQHAFVDPANLFDTDALVKERRLVPITYEPPEDLSSQGSEGQLR
jgi:hypothetical protein